MTSTQAALAAGIFTLAVGAVLAQTEGGAPPPPTAVDPEALIGAPDGPPITGEILIERTEELSSRMRCPVCQALSVADSPSLSALAIKEEVRDLLAAGYTESQVIDYFERAYGEFIRLAPKPVGFNLVVWWAPAVALLAGAGLVFLRLRRRPALREPVAASPAGTAPPPATGDNDLSDYLERVRREVGGRP